MKTVQWQMQENFVFPTAVGMPTGAEKVMVTPRFKVERTEDSLRLIGIYHLAVSVQMNLEVSIEASVESATLIDDVELNGNLGYFEYAVPFNIDLPPEAQDPLNIVTTNATCQLDGQGAVAIIWDVECSYREVIIVQEQNAEPKEDLEVKDEVKVEKATPQKTDKKTEKEVNKELEAEPKREIVQKVELKPEPELEPVVESDVADESLAVASTVKLENVSFNDNDEALSFIAGLDDGIATTLFRSNDVPVQSES